MVPIADQLPDVEELFARVNALFQAREYAEAALLLTSYLDRSPDQHPRALHALGAIACEQGDFEAARRYISRVLALEPASAPAHNAMGNISRAENDPAEAAGWYRRALELDPDLHKAHHNLGVLALGEGDLDSADEHFERAAELEPTSYFSLLYRAFAKSRKGEREAALALYQRARDVDPHHPDAWVGSARILCEKKLGIESEEVCRQGLLATGDHPSLLSYLGTALLVQGRVRECVECQKTVLASDPLQNQAHQTLQFALNYDPDASQEEIHALARTWEADCFASIPRTSHSPNPGDRDKVLRVGYVSADLKRHPVGYHLLPVLRNYDRNAFQVYCYSNTSIGDDLTDEFVSLSEGWRMIGHLSDEQAVELIRRDGIDILVDLSGHTSGSRLPLFARKPAPVQATWLGYFNTTGLSAIDYLLTDDATVLPGEDQWFAERVLRLPWSRFCFAPFSPLPDLVPPPSLERGYVTFGSFNNLSKLNQRVISLWCSIMRELPDSRLVLKRGELGAEAMRQRFRAMFAAEGIAPERLDLRSESPCQEMYAQYGDVDIALDPFPFCGGMTTLDALLMGVPVVTLSGKLPISRQSRAFLRALNLLELVATREQRYQSLVLELARDPERLARLRGELRERVLRSYLCDGKGFTVNLEIAYRSMWRSWCDSAPSADPRKGA